MRHAEWDEYKVRVRSLSDAPVMVTEVVLIDPLETRVVALADRGELMGMPRARRSGATRAPAS
jgi:hypothetical protein